MTCIEDSSVLRNVHVDMFLLHGLSGMFSQQIDITVSIILGNSIYGTH